MTTQFTDSAHDDLELCQELIRGMPAGAQKRAHTAATRLIEVWDKLKKDAPKDPAVAVGAAYAVFYIADHIINSQTGPISDNLIITLSR